MLTPERIKELSEQHLDASLQFGRLWIEGEEEFARAIEAEVRKDDEALIRQMLEALEWLHFGASQAGLSRDPMAAIAAARARLEKAP